MFVTLRMEVHVCLCVII